MIWLGLLALLACSALVSGSETALFALSRVTLSQFRASPSALQRRAHRLMQRPRAVLMTVLITNTAINVAIFAVSFVALEGADVAEAHATDDPPSAGDARVGGDAPAASPSAAASAIGSIAVLIAVILFGEMVPKAVALSSAKRIAPAATLLIGALYAVLGPVQWVLHTFVVDPLTRLLSPVTHVPDVVSPEELRLLVERSAREGIISSKEHEMLQGAVALGDAGVREVMTPRVDIQAASADADVASVCADMRASHRRRLPVCGADLDDIRGMLHARDLYLAPTASISELMREAHFVPEHINLVQLIR
ncbi:MAG: CNNM domain-containing protein, partial [Phycisphaerae bacterium]